MATGNKKQKNEKRLRIASDDFSRAQTIAHLASFTELNPRPVVEIDLRGNVLYANPSADFSFPDLRKKAKNHPYLSGLKDVIPVLKNGHKHVSRDINIKGRWFRRFLYYLPHSSTLLIYGADMTEKKQEEEILKESEGRYHALFDKMDYGYALQDIIFNKNKKPLDYRFIDVNPAFERLTKIKREDILGKTANDLAKQSPNSPEKERNRKLYDKVATTGKPLFMETYNPLLKKHFKVCAYRPNPAQISLIFSDITKEKKSEEEKNNFIAILSHELRNPLTPILANTQFLQSIFELQGKKQAIVDESLRIIEKQAKIMADLLNDILDVSRMSQRKLQLKKRKINLCEVIKNSVRAAMPFINVKKQKVSVIFEQSSIFINADPLRMEQILMNLLSNASKYTPQEGHLRVGCSIEKNEVHLSVKDNGVGMSCVKISRIFELFSSQSKPFMGIGGLGIGLNIVKHLVLLHQGNIIVKSVGKDKGTEFIITFPLAKQGKAQKEPREEKALSPAFKVRKQRILVVDDNHDILQSIARILNGRGYSVRAVGTGKAAIKISKAFKPDVALVDIGLPDLSGYRVAEMLRKQEKKQIKLVAFSGYGQEEHKKNSREAGFDYHLTKPVDVQQLLKIVSSRN